MKYAVLAAGDGSRLVQEGETRPKPLIRVGGEMLIDRLLRVFMTNDATESAVILSIRSFRSRRLQLMYKHSVS